jgi:GNAT superfamily N-acetyltransferase
MSISLRTALDTEAEHLTELALRSKRAWGYDEDFMASVMPDMIVHPQYLQTEYGIVAERDGIRLGYAIVRIDGDVAFLRDLFVEPQYFRQGIGRALFLAAVEYARTNGASALRLSGDPNARGFYERLGMIQVDEEPSIVGAGRLLPIMHLDLT